MPVITRRLALIAAALALTVAGCGASATPAPSAGPTADPNAGPQCVDGSITASGSTALQPLVEAAAKQYAAACPNATVNVQGGGSGTGLTQVLQGAVQLGNSDVSASSKLPPADAATLVDHVIALQGWLMVNNPKVTGVTNLTRQQAIDIWTGKTTNWKDVGGPDAQIVLIIRPASSGTRSTFRKIVLQGQLEATGQALTEDSSGSVTTAVENTDYATSVLAYAYYVGQKDKLVGLALGGVEASVENFVNGTYLLQDYGHMYTKGQPDGLTKAFADYMLSNDVQHTLLPSLSYAPATK
jgi:phosphate transport system substrate-binding protein